MRLKSESGIFTAVKRKLSTDTVFWENEVAANLFTAKAMLLFAGVLVLSWILNGLGVFAVSDKVLGPIVLTGIAELVLPAALCLLLRGEKWWLKYLLILELTIEQARIDSILSYNVVMAMLVPVVLSCRYFSQRFTRQITVLSSVLFAVSAFCGAWFDLAEYNLMYQAASKALYTRNIMLQFFLPKWLMFVLLSVVCIEIAKWGRQSVLKQAAISDEQSRVETELEMARKIQKRALPEVFPLQAQPQFDLAAKMDAAKQVGGDFYDFFSLDRTHLVLMIADVSGKGVPAALFMMAAKLLLDNSIASGKTPGQALEEVNHQLCEKNMENMFVTVWLGILDLESGDMVTANAGHEYPLLCRSGGSFEPVKDRHGFVLGGMDGMKYRETTLHLDPGDILFVYTDGVPEANDENGSQFGMDRMLASLNGVRTKTMQEITDQLKTDIDRFAGQAHQFDDITMLAIRLNG